MENPVFFPLKAWSLVSSRFSGRPKAWEKPLLTLVSVAMSLERLDPLYDSVNSSREKILCQKPRDGVT